MSTQEQTALPLSAIHIAPCGMNCALCIAYLRNQKKCPGCHGEDAQKPYHCVNCSIRNCQGMLENEVSFCSGCLKFPCRRIKQLDKRYREKYHMSMIENLHQIKEEGMDAFLQGQISKWICPGCGGFVCVHRGRCIACEP